MKQVLSFIKSITEDELEFISRADYGADREKHKAALKEVIFQQDGIISQEQIWYPYEVIELCSHVLPERNERPFVFCTLLILINVEADSDGCTDLEYKWETRRKDYDRLTPKCKELILTTYARTMC